MQIVRKYWEEEFDLAILMMYMFSVPLNTKSNSPVLPVCAPEWLDEFYLYLVFKIVSIIDWCLVNKKIVLPKIVLFQMAQKQNCYCLKNVSSFD
jgi:hypothetical protein